MKPPKAFDIRTVGRNDAGDLVVDVKLRRRSVYAVRLFYRTLRRHGLGRLRSAEFAVRLALTSTEGATP